LVLTGGNRFDVDLKSFFNILERNRLTPINTHGHRHGHKRENSGVVKLTTLKHGRGYPKMLLMAILLKV